MYKNAKVSLHLVIITTWVIFYILLSFLDLTSLSGSMDFDSNLILDIASGASDTSDNSYYYTALFFQLIPDFIQQWVIIAIGSAAIIFFMNSLRTRFTLALAAYITLPAIILIMVRPQKETIVILMVMLITYILSSPGSIKNKIIITVLIYTAYSLFLRQYYFIIIAAFLTITAFIYLPTPYKIVTAIFMLAVLLIIPEDILIKLQGQRDLINYWRLNSGELGSRTAFSNFTDPGSTIGFCINYIYAVLRLNIPILFHLGIKELWMFSITTIYFTLIFIGIKSKHPELVLPCSMILAHILVYMLFEPDLGSYLRHLSSTFLYLTPVLVMIDLKKAPDIK